MPTRVAENLFSVTICKLCEGVRVLEQKSMENQIKDRWFKDHKAELKDLGEIQILNWKKPGTICYYIRYIFDGNKMYVSGDLGEAVFWLTWNADVHSFNGIHIDYFAKKLRAYHGER